PGSHSQTTPTYKLYSTWNTSGASAGIQQLWCQVLGEDASADSLAAVLTWLQDQGWLVWSSIGQQANEVEGYQVELGTLEFMRGSQAVRCHICGRIAANEDVGSVCPRLGCAGRLLAWEGSLAAANINALLIAAEHTPLLRPAEHSAAVSDEVRQQIEAG